VTAFLGRRLESINNTENSSRTLDAKVYSQEGNSPDYFLRSLKYLLVIQWVYGDD